MILLKNDHIYGKVLHIATPEYTPVFSENDILISSNSYELANGSKRTTVGWLKELFLYHYVDDKKVCFEIRPEDRKDFKSVLEKFQVIAKLKKPPTIETLHEWEEDPKNTAKKQASVLNKLRKKLGYTEEVEV